MIDIFFQYIYSYPLLIMGVIFSEIVLFLIAVSFMKNHSIRSYHEIQKIHHGHTSRLGGLCIFLALFIGFVNRPFMVERQLIYDLFLCFTPVLLITTFEDFHFQIKPLYRLFAMIVASLLMVIFSLDRLPELSIPVIQSVINLPYILPIFYTIALIALMNGMNFIDGANGLSAVTAMGIFLGLSLMAYFIGDFDFLMVILLFFTPLIVFLIFNYPWGKIFMGDVGAYWFGWVLGVCIIYFFSKHDNLLTWSVPVLLFYPMMEVTFSIIRKVIQKKSPFEPDAHHLHLKIYFMSKRILNNHSRRANNIVMPALTFFWLTPPVLAALFYSNLPLTLLSLGALITIYISLYMMIPFEISD